MSPPLQRARYLVPLLWGTLGCDPLISNRDPDKDELSPGILIVSPATLDWGPRPVGEAPETRSLQLFNAGDLPLVIHGHDELRELAGPPDVFTQEQGPILELAAGETLEIPYQFKPDQNASFAAELWINGGLERVSLQGEGLAGALTANLPDFSPTGIGCSEESSIELMNTGRLPLQIAHLDLLDPQDSFSFDPPVLPIELFPNESLSLPLRFRPGWTEEGGGERTASLRVITDQPQAREQILPLEGLSFEGEAIEERFTYTPGLDQDLLLVADTDGLMAAWAGQVAEASPALIDAFDRLALSTRIAVLTGADSCPSTSLPWTEADEQRSRRIDHLTEGLAGLPGQGSDALLIHAAAALGSSCFADFQRPGALLHVAVLAGGPDTSDKALEAQIADLSSVAGSNLIISALIATDSTSCGGLSYGAGYADAALETGGAIVDLCGLELERELERLATVVLERSRGAMEHTLGRPPVIDSLQVEVNGRPAAGWAYDPIRRILRFEEAEGPGHPEAGDRIDLRYIASCD